MKLPVDIEELFNEMMDINSARNTEISVSVFIDERAPSDVVALIRGEFASSSDKVRMTLSYLDSSFVPHEGDDMAIIVAGSSHSIGAAAAAIRAVGVPVVVVTTQPATVERLAKAGGHAIPFGDLVAPCEGDESAEPFELTEELSTALIEQLGRWVAFVCWEKRVAFSIAFPFMRRALAVDSVQSTSLQNAGIGLVSFVPGADLPILTLNQVKMVLQIAAAYGQDMNKDRIMELAAVVGGAYVCRALARELVELVPVLGFLVRAGVAYGGTAAMGYAVIDYFEGGKDAAGVANVATRATQRATRFFKTVKENPEEIVSNVNKSVGQTVSLVRDRVAELTPVARDLVSEYAPKARDAAKEYAPQVRQAVDAAIKAK